MGLQTCMFETAQSEVRTCLELFSFFVRQHFARTGSPWAEDLCFCPPHYGRLDCLLGARRRQKIIIAVGGHECTLRLIPLLQFEVTQQDTESILHLTMTQVSTKRKQQEE